MCMHSSDNSQPSESRVYTVIESVIATVELHMNYDWKVELHMNYEET